MTAVPRPRALKPVTEEFTTIEVLRQTLREVVELVDGLEERVRLLELRNAELRSVRTRQAVELADLRRRLALLES